MPSWTNWMKRSRAQFASSGVTTGPLMGGRSSLVDNRALSRRNTSSGSAGPSARSSAQSRIVRENAAELGFNLFHRYTGVSTPQLTHNCWYLCFESEFGKPIVPDDMIRSKLHCTNSRIIDEVASRSIYPTAPGRFGILRFLSPAVEVRPGHLTADRASAHGTKQFIMVKLRVEYKQDMSRPLTGHIIVHHVSDICDIAEQAMGGKAALVQIANRPPRQEGLGGSIRGGRYESNSPHFSAPASRTDYGTSQSRTGYPLNGSISHVPTNSQHSSSRSSQNLTPAGGFRPAYWDNYT